MKGMKNPAFPSVFIHVHLRFISLHEIRSSRHSCHATLTV
jgi:hypothetical protein